MEDCEDYTAFEYFVRLPLTAEYFHSIPMPLSDSYHRGLVVFEVVAEGSLAPADRQ